MAKKRSILEAVAGGLSGTLTGIELREKRQERETRAAERKTEAEARKESRKLNREIQVTSLQRGLESDIRAEKQQGEESALAKSREKRLTGTLALEEKKFKSAAVEKGLKFAGEKELADIKLQMAKLGLMDAEQQAETKKMGRASILASKEDVAGAIKLLGNSFGERAINVKNVGGNMVVTFPGGRQTSIPRNALMRGMAGNGDLGLTIPDAVKENRAQISDTVLDNKLLRGALKDLREEEDSPLVLRERERINKRLSDNMREVTRMRNENAKQIQAAIRGDEPAALTTPTSPDSLISRSVLEQPQGQPPGPGAQPSLRLPIGGGVSVPSAPGPGGAPQPAAPAGQAPSATQPAGPGGFNVDQVIQAGVPEAMARAVDSNQDGNASNEELNDLLTKATRILEPKTDQDVAISGRASEFQKEQARQTKRAIENLLRGRAQTLVGGQ